MFTFDTWLSLPLESRVELAKLLPPTAFCTFIPRIDPAHPSVMGGDPMDIDLLSEHVPEALDSMFFSDSYFLAALRTFQDHLHNGWLTEDHRTKINKYRAGIEDGTLHAAWKDEAWSQNQVEGDAAGSSKSGSILQRQTTREIKLSDLVEGGFLGIGDILVYRRTFSLINVTVEKDVMIAGCGRSSKSIVVLVPSGTTRYLPPALASSSIPTEDLLPDDDSLLEMTITTPSSLESGILDTDSRVDKPQRTNGNAWKYLSVWKFLQGGGTDGFASPERGERQNTGTLHYLRSSVYYGR
ncbi:hypothetical protein BDM02DRAFT_3116982 [Thelephora ganbajun]|uniref:Uncharacterized protein n=1 Tax=Thelephora ganbajun TaxID=370292 RepID=A0ACB6ZD18_THEGA|nr:hypothetical protein BDM02DRAFT_3116982 [Thelephora ganbajun]